MSTIHRTRKAVEEATTKWIYAMGWFVYLLGWPCHALASAGEVDLSFDPGSSIDSTIQAVVQQPDGRWLIAGDFTTVHGAMRGRVTRLNADGTTDHSFMNGLAGANGTVWAIAMQSDGKVLIAGDFTSVNGQTRNRIARLNADGTLDNSFGDGLAGAGSTVYALAVQSDGKVVIGGDFTSVNGQLFVSRIARLNSDGTLDSSWSGLSSANRTVLSLRVQSDGKILIGGDFTLVNGEWRNRIARLNADGTLDSSFGINLLLYGANNSVESLAVQSDGKVLIGGIFSSVDGQTRSRIARLNSDGTLDSSFGDGLAGASGAVYSIALQIDGRMLIGGEFTSVNGVLRYRIARLNADGTLDSSFADGLVGANSAVSSVALQTDGKLLIGGDFTSVNGQFPNRIARLNANGTLDSSFRDDLAGADSTVLSLAVQSDGKVVIGGRFSSVNGQMRNRIARLNADGTLDSSFGDGLAGADSTVYALAMQSDGKVLIGGGFTSVNGQERNRIARLNADGTLDSSFGDGLGGVGSTVSTVYALAVQGDGKVLIGGEFTSVNGQTRSRISRLNADGALDGSFGDGLAGANGIVMSLAVQSDGKLLIGGDFTSVNGVLRNRIARLNADGTLDSSFGDGLAGATNPIRPRLVRAIAVQSDGKVLIGGDFTSVNGQTRNHIARLNADGTLDSSFGDGLAGAGSTVYALAVQGDGKVVIGGGFASVNGQTRNRIARLNVDGTLDSSFGASLDRAIVAGVVRGGRSPSSPVAAWALAVQSDGEILVAGDFSSVNDVARDRVARLLGDSPSISPISLDFMIAGSHLVLSWTNPAFSLQSAPVTVGIYTNINGATSPYTNYIFGSQQFFRLRGN